MKVCNRVLFLCLLCLTHVSLAHAVITNVPNILSAPVVLFDEGGNVLPDGNYGVTISIKDSAGSTLYVEEQNAAVVSGTAGLTIGEGYTVGSSYTSHTGGLALDIFQTAGDLTVEIAVAGQSVTQAVAVLGSQPFSYVSQYAIGVADNSVTSSSITDGTIVAADLDASFLSEIQTPTLVDSNGTAITAAEITVPADIGLNNSGAGTVSGVLQDLDNAIESLRDIDLSQSLDSLRSDEAATYINKDGSLAMTGDLDLGAHNIINVGFVDGVDVSDLKVTVDALDGTFATDVDVAAVNDTIAHLNDTYATDADITTLQTTINDLDSTYATDVDVAVVNDTIAHLNDTYATDVDITTLQTTINNLNSTYATDADVSALSSTVSSLSSSLSSTTSTVSSLSSTVSSLSSSLASTDSTLSSLSTTVSSLNTTYATDTEVSSSYVAKSGDTMTGTLTMSGANIVMSAGKTVDGVDVSALSTSVTSLDTRVTALETDQTPDAVIAYAYGTKASGGSTSCTGYNIDSDCTFTTNPSDTSYVVVLTPQGSAGCGSYAGICTASSKTTAGFTAQCTCPSGGTWNPAIDFVVFYNP